MKVKWRETSRLGHHVKLKRLVEVLQDEVDGAVNPRHVSVRASSRFFALFSQDLSNPCSVDVLELASPESQQLSCPLSCFPQSESLNTPPIMKHLLFLLLAVGATLRAFAADPSDDAKAIQGSWKPATAELAGQPLPETVLAIISLKLDHGKYEVYVGDAPDKGTYTLDSGATPKAITVIGTDGPNQGQTFPAIYELQGDTLRICYDLSGAKRPTEFKSVAGTKLYLVTYKR